MGGLGLKWINKIKGARTMKRCKNCESVVTNKTEIRLDKQGEIEKIWLVQECNCLSHSVSLDYAIENGELYTLGVWGES